MRQPCTSRVMANATGYAKDNIDADRWTGEGAMERSRADFDSLLRDGLGTPDNYLFEIRNTNDGTTVGYLWFAVILKHG